MRNPYMNDEGNRMRDFYKNGYRIHIEHRLGDVGGNRHSHTLELFLYIEPPTSLLFLSYPAIDEPVLFYLAKYHKKYLNELKMFQNLPPTLENLGDLLFEDLSIILMKNGFRLSSLEISETPLRVYIVSDIL